MDESRKDAGPQPDEAKPQPREALGIAELINGQVVDLRPGHDPAPPPAEAIGRGEDERPAVLPPFKPETTPGLSLSERIRQGLTGEEGSK